MPFSYGNISLVFSYNHHFSNMNHLLAVKVLLLLPALSTRSLLSAKLCLGSHRAWELWNKTQPLTLWFIEIKYGSVAVCMRDGKTRTPNKRNGFSPLRPRASSNFWKITFTNILLVNVLLPRRYQILKTHPYVNNTFNKSFTLKITSEIEYKYRIRGFWWSLQTSWSS